MLGVVVACALAVGTVAAGQGRDVKEILAGARTALGAQKLEAVKTLTAVGRTTRALPNGTSTESEFEIALELPDKYLMRSVLAAMGNMSVYRNSGFNGGQVIEEIDRPPSLSGGNIVIRMAGPGGVTDPEKMTAEEKADYDQKRLVANKREFAKLALGMFAMSPAAYPVELADGGQAESPDGKADVIDVKGEGGFVAKLFIDAQTHLPLMLSWMDKEPITMMVGPGGTVTTGGAPAAGAAGGGNATFTRVERSGGAPPTPEEREKMMKDLEARRKEAEAKARTVEYRLYYGDYKTVGGVQLPHRIQRSIDGKPTEEMTFDTIKVNPRIDAKKFQVAK
jgi:hypothetical protein